MLLSHNMMEQAACKYSVSTYEGMIVLSTDKRAVLMQRFASKPRWFWPPHLVSSNDYASVKFALSPPLTQLLQGLFVVLQWRLAAAVSTYTAATSQSPSIRMRPVKLELRR